MVPGRDSVVSEDGKTVQLLTVRCCSGLGTCQTRLYPFACLLVFSIVQELCESRGGRPGLSVLTSLLVSVDVKNY